MPLVEVRIVGDDGDELPWDGEATGEIEVRGPWIAADYYNDPTGAEKFHDGWLRTGDVASIDAQGFMRISDRAKDVIKSGGEWISSVELENELMAHPTVLEAAVIAKPDERWTERPLACVVLCEGAGLHGRGAPRRTSAPRVAKWWIPDEFAFIDEVPKTSVGKFDKKVLRRQLAEGELDLASGRGAPPGPAAAGPLSGQPSGPCGPIHDDLRKAERSYQHGRRNRSLRRVGRDLRPSMGLGGLGQPGRFDRAVMARFGAYVFLAAGTLGVALLALPHPQAQNRPGMLAASLAAYLGAAVLIAGYDRLPDWAFQAIVSAGILTDLRRHLLPGPEPRIARGPVLRGRGRRVLLLRLEAGSRADDAARPQLRRRAR